MNNLSLTVGINSVDFNKDFTSNKVISMEELNDQYLVTIGNWEQRKNGILKYLVGKSYDMTILGKTITTVGEYEELKQELRNYQISKVYIKIADNYEEYKKIFEQYSKWLNQSPDEVRMKNGEANKKRLELIRQLQKDGVDIQILE